MYACVHGKQTGLSRIFSVSGRIRRSERERENSIFCPLSFRKVHLSHTLDDHLNRPDSVPAITGLLLGAVVALILIPISAGILLLLRTMVGIITTIAAHRAPRSSIRTGSFRHIPIVHRVRWSFHTSIWLICLHWIHAKATVPHAHLIRWSTERLIVVAVVVVLWWSIKCAKTAYIEQTIFRALLFIDLTWVVISAIHLIETTIIIVSTRIVLSKSMIQLRKRENSFGHLHFVVDHHNLHDNYYYCIHLGFLD